MTFRKSFKKACFVKAALSLTCLLALPSFAQDPSLTPLIERLGQTYGCRDKVTFLNSEEKRDFELLFDSDEPYDRIFKLAEKPGRLAVNYHFAVEKEVPKVSRLSVLGRENLGSIPFNINLFSTHSGAPANTKLIQYSRDNTPSQFLEYIYSSVDTKRSWSNYFAFIVSDETLQENETVISDMVGALRAKEGIEEYPIENVLDLPNCKITRVQKNYEIYQSIVIASAAQPEESVVRCLFASYLTHQGLANGIKTYEHPSIVQELRNVGSITNYYLGTGARQLRDLYSRVHEQVKAGANVCEYLEAWSQNETSMCVAQATKLSKDPERHNFFIKNADHCARFNINF